MRPVIDINKEMKTLEIRYRDFFDNNLSRPDSKLSIGEFYGIIEDKVGSVAFIEERNKEKLPDNVLKEMQAIIDAYNSQ